MPRWFRLLAATLIYAMIMVIITRTIHVWALPVEERTFESVASRLLTLFAFAIISGFVVYRLFVRSGRNRQGMR